MKKIGIGYEDYKKFIDEKMYYVDKTLLVKDLVEKGGSVTLFTRPRRFGKTIALSMLRTFFELEYDTDGNEVDKQRYFDGMKIMEADESIISMMGQYPVINISLKSAKQPLFYTTFLKIRDEIISEFTRHGYLKDSFLLSEDARTRYNELLERYRTWYEREQGFKTDEEKKNAIIEEAGHFATALKTLSECLKQYHGKNVIILIDEYDVPLENAYFQGFYDEMVSFIRSLFESALKTNDALERAVITGCLRISKESIFTGLNNLEVNSIRGRNFGEYFGFTQDETENMLKAYGLENNICVVKDWYDGYLFGESEVYNPWSVTKYVSEHEGAPYRFAEPYWANTSSNSIIKEFIEGADEELKEELETLISGGTIEKLVHEDITYDDIHENENNLWNFLFFTGYMKKVSERQDGEDIYVTMCIPNREVRSIYRNQIRNWFDRVVKNAGFSELHVAILKRDTEKISDYVSDLLAKCISTFDSSEDFYHGFFLSLLNGVPHYSTRSNREEGTGRPDIVLYPKRPKDPAYIFELKIRKKYNEMDDGIAEAFRQINDQKYEEGILDDGYAGVISYGVCFCKKSCIVKLK
ncbi:MAG: ATP-binding protein [Lachnospiraceae bacterium]|nr:ATP-binding protein [Lachnospiraceae bacterium]